MNHPDHHSPTLRPYEIRALASAPLERELLQPNTIGEIPVAMVVASPHQPRLVFNMHRLSELKESIGIQGLIKPIMVRLTAAGYELIGGERRWRAVVALGWETIPAMVREISDAQAMLLAMLDNIDEPLTDYENALAYARILRLGHERSQASLAASLGINKSIVSRCLLLVELPENIQAILREKPGLITANYAKKFIDYTKQDAFVVERVIRSAMTNKDPAKCLGQVATLQLIGQRLSACTQVDSQIRPKRLTGFGTMKIKGQRLEIKCEAGIDPILLQEHFEKFLSQIDPSILRAEHSAKKQE
ncbi:ParB/RepB/Spo0J family partition protein [Pseudomonas sp. RP23018S]|uniref:ParB/RepB/Spo0J family partition protein n=1 Tax=Pseudomonas sp. RP23018S TaxID=3096037 RepID=UPI002ACA5F08|nr:ParB/RepB/Spo0J family partition protein [Pseudomonas sp. RP23018S]MDZ5605283.1 ParB/RepB/Spo0J family partition protein [Pseudomonas sp. RP23018S]